MPEDFSDHLRVVEALFYTLCETARLVGVDPHAYLLSALYAAIAEPGTVTFPDALVSPAD